MLPCRWQAGFRNARWQGVCSCCHRSASHDARGVDGVVAGKQIADDTVPAHDRSRVDKDDVTGFEREIGGQHVGAGASCVQVEELWFTVLSTADYIDLMWVTGLWIHASGFA